MLNIGMLLVGSLSMGWDYPLSGHFQNVGLGLNRIHDVWFPISEASAVETKANELGNVTNRTLLREFEVSRRLCSP